MAKEMQGKSDEVGGKLQLYKKILGEMIELKYVSWPSNWQEAVDYIGQYIKENEKENDSQQLIKENRVVLKTVENISELLALFQNATTGEEVFVGNPVLKKLVEEINKIGEKYTEDTSVGSDSKHSSSVPITVAPLEESSLLKKRQKKTLNNVTSKPAFPGNQPLTLIAG